MKEKSPLSEAPAAVPPALNPQLRIYLYITAAITGAAILIVEILGAKMLSPYVGTSHFVWTGQITMTLLALSCGYYLGGRLVDRSRSLTHLYTCILLASIYLCLTVLIVKPLVYYCLQWPLALASLISSLVLFFPPLTLLAVTGPFLIRVLSISLESVGGNAGRLSAISTLGSVAGTLLIGYVIIPFMPNSVIMYITGGALAVVSAIYFFAWGRKSSNTPAVVAGLILAAVTGGFGARQNMQANYKNGEQIFFANSNFGQLQILKMSDGSMYYLNDFLFQNGYDPAQKKSIFGFTYVLHDLAHAYCPKTENVLCIGVGIGVVPMEFAGEGSKVSAVEINPAVLTMAEKYFNFVPSKIDLHVGDGRQWLNTAPAGRFDAILLDAFLGDSNPWHLMTRESFEAMSRSMNPDGVLVINTFCSFEQGKDFYGASLYKTLKSVFKNVHIHRQLAGNTYFVASNQEKLVMNPAYQPDFTQVHLHCQREVESAFHTILGIEPKGGIVLTDDYNPVDYYDAPNREAERRALAVNAQRMQGE